MTNDDVKRAIIIVEDARRTHVQWAAFIESGATWTPKAGDVGDLDHHLECVADYDHVIAVLRTVDQPSA